MRTLTRWLGFGLAALVLLLALAAGAAWVAVGRGMSKRYDVPAERFAAAMDSAAVERGGHFAVAIAKCATCHGGDMAGMVIIENAAFGRLVASNLTPGRGGIGAEYTDADWERAIRHGVGRDGRPLRFMPAADYAAIGDRDLADLVAYLKTLAPVDRALPATRIGPMARVLALVTPDFPLLSAARLDHGAPHPAAPAPAATREYGAYLAHVGGCTGCHGADLTGGRGGPPPTPPDISPAALADWTEEDFFRVLRTGVRPDGRVLNTAMPWPATAQMTDDEIRALWQYVQGPLR
ncbi:MAG TPA: c-type cytochrome [Longimicrobiales bacterium]